MSDLKCAKLLLRAAERDLLTLRSMADSTPEESVGFHVQQAAQKALKAWLAVLGHTYPLTHSLELLIDLLARQGVAVGSFRALADYTPYAVEFRYAGVDPGAERIDREGAFATVDGLLERVRREVSEAATGGGGAP